MNAIRHTYSLTLGLIIGVLSSFSVLLLGIIGVFLWAFSESDKVKKWSEKKKDEVLQFYQNNSSPNVPVPTEEEIEQALSKPATKNTKFVTDPRAGVPDYRLFDGSAQKLGTIVNDITNHLTRDGYVTINEVQALMGETTRMSDGDMLGWTNEEFNINTIEMAPKTEPTNRGLYTLILPKPIDITSFLPSENK